MSGIEQGLDELEQALEQQLRDEWAFQVVLMAAWHHSRDRPSCVGFTMSTAGRATCGECGWGVSGWLSDVGSRRSAVFALFALGCIGATLQLAQDFAVTYTRCRWADARDVRIDGQGNIEYTVELLPVAQVIHRIDL